MMAVFDSEVCPLVAQRKKLLSSSPVSSLGYFVHFSDKSVVKNISYKKCILNLH